MTATRSPRPSTALTLPGSPSSPGAFGPGRSHHRSGADGRLVSVCSPGGVSEEPGEAPVLLPELLHERPRLADLVLQVHLFDVRTVRVRRRSGRAPRSAHYPAPSRCGPVPGWSGPALPRGHGRGHETALTTASTVKQGRGVAGHSRLQWTRVDVVDRAPKTVAAVRICPEAPESTTATVHSRRGKAALAFLSCWGAPPGCRARKEFRTADVAGRRTRGWCSRGRVWPARRPARRSRRRGSRAPRRWPCRGGVVGRARRIGRGGP